MRFDSDRVFYIIAIYLGRSSSLPQRLYQPTVSKLPKGYIVQIKGIRFYYSSKESLLNDWDLLYFEKESTNKTEHRINHRKKVIQKMYGG